MDGQTDGPPENIMPPKSGQSHNKQTVGFILSFNMAKQNWNLASEEFFGNWRMAGLAEPIIKYENETNINFGCLL